MDESEFSRRATAVSAQAFARRVADAITAESMVSPEAFFKTTASAAGEDSVAVASAIGAVLGGAGLHPDHPPGTGGAIMTVLAIGIYLGRAAAEREAHR